MNVLVSAVLFQILVKKSSNGGTNIVNPSRKLPFLIDGKRNKKELSFQLTNVGSTPPQLNDKKR